jgi:Bacterial DNA-binding protein
MATKKAPAKKTAAPIKKVATKTSAPGKKTATAVKTAPAVSKKTTATKKMSKTELVRLVAEKMELTTKQAGTFFDLLAQTAIQETKKNGEFTIPGLGKLVKPSSIRCLRTRMAFVAPMRFRPGHSILSRKVGSARSRSEYCRLPSKTC